MDDQIPRLAMKDIVKSFGPNRVLNGVSFSIMPGEIVALLGSNGAGKSTLMKILTAVYTKDSGAIRVNDKAMEFYSPKDALQVGISFLPQEISVFKELSVAENICLGNQNGNLVQWSDMSSRARHMLDELGFGHLDPKTLVGDLPVAQQRIIEIARALEGDADIIVMDEPTASLSEKESVQIFAILQRLKSRGTSIVYISHYLKEVFENTDRIVVLRDGYNAGEFNPKTTEINTVVNAMLGQVAGNLFDDQLPRSIDGSVVFVAENLSYVDQIDKISFEVRRGEILGVFGLVGSGIEALGRLMFGAHGRIAGGSMALDGSQYNPSSPSQAKSAGMGFVTAERKTDGLLADLTVQENLVAAFQTDYGNGFLISPEIERQHAEKWIDLLGIKTSGPEQPIRLLSGGNQQKICVARWLNPKVKMLILEEPTRGVDVGARRDIYNHLKEFARNGLAILILSSDVEEVAGLSDRSLVIDRGKIIAEFASRATAAELLSASAQELQNSEKRGHYV